MYYRPECRQLEKKLKNSPVETDPFKIKNQKNSDISQKFLKNKGKIFMSDESKEQELKHSMHEHAHPTHPTQAGTEQEQINTNTEQVFTNVSNIEFLVQTIAHNTQRIEDLVTTMELIKARINLIEARPMKQLDLVKTVAPFLAVIVTLFVGSLGLEITTLVLIVNHIAGGH